MPTFQPKSCTGSCHRVDGAPAVELLPQASGVPSAILTPQSPAHTRHHLVKAGLGIWVSQQRFWCEDNQLEGKQAQLTSVPGQPPSPTVLAPALQKCTSRASTHWLAEGQQDLSAQDMEVVSWSGAVDDNPVTVIELAHLKIRSEGLWEERVAGGQPNNSTHILTRQVSIPGPIQRAALTGYASESSLLICRNLSGRAEECSGP